MRPSGPSSKTICGYVAPDRKVIGGGVVVEGRVGREGEAWSRGPVVLSWPGVLQGGRRELGTGNLVLHEFAHQLDMHNGDIVDGTPPLGNRAEYDRWQQVIQREYRRLVHDCERGAATLLDCYGTTDIGEFFAVATECFFQQPREMQQRHAELYEILSGFYRQDPAARCARPAHRSP
jgi:Mlc titration factor MtfA (ptsG expression regulator)